MPTSANPSSFMIAGANPQRAIAASLRSPRGKRVPTERQLKQAVTFYEAKALEVLHPKQSNSTL